MFYPESEVIAFEYPALSEEIRRVDQYLNERATRPFRAGQAADRLGINFAKFETVLALYKQHAVVTEETVWLCPEDGQEIEFVSPRTLHCPLCERDYTEEQCRSQVLFQPRAAPIRDEASPEAAPEQADAPRDNTLSSAQKMRLFICYAHVDKAIVKEWIVNTLVAGGHDAWFDERLQAGHNWKQQLRETLERSDALVYCMTPEAVASEWCQWELARAVEFGKPIIPVLLQAETQLPKSLQALHYVDFSSGPTGDAVARLMGGLQNLSPSQVPAAPANPRGTPTRASEEESSTSTNTMIRLLREPAFHGLIAIISVIVAVLAIAIDRSDDSDPIRTQVSAIPTPSTPVVFALRDLEIRSGPGAGSERIDILPVDGSLDVLGISKDRLWYQVLLQDGTTGWILASSRSAYLEGDRGAVKVIILTPTPLEIPVNAVTAIPTPAISATDLKLADHTPSVSVTDAKSRSAPTSAETQGADTISDPIPTNTTTHDANRSASTQISFPSPATFPSESSSTLTETSPSQNTFGYPCEGTIADHGSDKLRIIYSRANIRLTPIDDILPGSGITIMGDTYSGGRLWYEIVYDSNKQGWTWDIYVEPSANCP